VTAWASAPEVLVRQVIERLRALGARSVDELPGVVERVVFPMPRVLAPKTERAAGASRAGDALQSPR